MDTQIYTQLPIFGAFVGALAIVFKWLSDFLKSRDEMSRTMMMETMGKFETVAALHKEAVEKIVESHDKVFVRINDEIKNNSKILGENQLLMRGMISVITQQYGQEKVTENINKAKREMSIVT